MNQLDLNIKTPCQENFDAFKTTKNGGFCGSCQKEVIDFTTKSSEEIINYFKTNSTNTCGKFRNSQLTQYNYTSKKRKSIGILSGIGLAILSFFSFGKANAQDVVKNVNPEPIIEDAKDKIITVEGTVTADGMALPGATIILQGRARGLQTDFDGNFKFENLKKGDVLIFSYVGFKTRKITVTNNMQVINISLKTDDLLGEVIFMGKVAPKKVFKSEKDNE